jgi:hypothetical protein
MSDTELVELLRAARSKSNAQPDRLSLRVLLRLALTVLLAIPVCLALALFLALEARPSRLRPPRAANPASPKRAWLSPSSGS